jgi:hypothetical protein
MTLLVLVLTIFAIERWRHPDERFQSADRNFAPIGGSRTAVLPLTERDPRSLSVEQCRQIQTYSMVHPVERVDRTELNRAFDECQQKLAKRVRFDDRVQVVTSNDSLYSESLNS